MTIVIDTIATIIFTALLPPFFGIVVVVVTLASLGKTLGIRQKYVDGLLYIFEFGKKRLAKHRKYLNSTSDANEDEEEEKNKSKSQTNAVSRKISTVEEYLFPPTGLPLERHEFALSDAFEYITRGMEAIVDDEVTKRFSAEELTSWNFLTRTNLDYEFISVRLTVFWVVGFIVRYVFLFPLRVCILGIGVGLLVSFTAFINLLPEGPFRVWLGNHTYLTCFRVVARAISSVIYFHNEENRPRQDGICVANHTSPIDCVILSCDNVYAFVGQRHGGFLGIFQRALSRASDHIWFERGEVKDRFAVAKRLKNHVEDPNKMPILIFPEGTCINNTSVMQFKKGTFEVGGIIYPVAIKYDARFGDAFWNSSKFSMLSYLYMMMTSWAIVCDVWYLPPMVKREDESSIEFANRVKAEIAKQGGLVDLLWDGALKRSAPKKELKEHFQHEFSRRLKLHDISESKLSNDDDDDYDEDEGGAALDKASSRNRSTPTHLEPNEVPQTMSTASEARLRRRQPAAGKKHNPGSIDSPPYQNGWKEVDGDATTAKVEDHSGLDDRKYDRLKSNGEVGDTDKEYLEINAVRPPVDIVLVYNPETKTSGSINHDDLVKGNDVVNGSADVIAVNSQGLGTHLNNNSETNSVVIENGLGVSKKHSSDKSCLEARFPPKENGTIDFNQKN